MACSHFQLFELHSRFLRLNLDEICRLGFSYPKELVTRERVILQGTIVYAKYALKYSVTMNVAGGIHHALGDRGEGFCSPQ